MAVVLRVVPSPLAPKSTTLKARESCCANNRFAARHKRRNKKTNAGAEVKTIEVPELRLSLSAIVTDSLSDLPMAPTKAIF